MMNKTKDRSSTCVIQNQIGGIGGIQRIQFVCIKPLSLSLSVVRR